MTETEDTITLPLMPKDYAYEDYVASVLNVGGYYLERGIHKRSKNDILELDIVTSKFTENGVEKTISEIKSGGWGFPEIFKVRGWLDYLGFEKASFVVQNPDPNQETYNSVASESGISMIVTEESEGNLNYSQIQEVYAINHTAHENTFVENLRFSYALERKLIADICATAKSDKDLEGFQILKQYLFDLCDNTFFEPMASGRIYRTFKLFTEHRHITARLDHETGTCPYPTVPDDDISISESSFRRLFYGHDAKDKLYGALYVEMLNRIHVLKHCVEDMLQPEEEQDIAKFLKDLNHAVLPSHIKEAMDEFRTHPYFHLYPYFWQIFVFLFGGFILEDKKEEEYKLLSGISGIPEAEIDRALSAFDILFPIDDGWMKTVPRTTAENTEIHAFTLLWDRREPKEGHILQP